MDTLPTGLAAKSPANPHMSSDMALMSLGMTLKSVDFDLLAMVMILMSKGKWPLPPALVSESLGKWLLPVAMAGMAVAKMFKSDAMTTMPIGNPAKTIQKRWHRGSAWCVSGNVISEQRWVKSSEDFKPLASVSQSN